MRSRGDLSELRLEVHGLEERLEKRIAMLQAEVDGLRAYVGLPDVPPLYIMGPEDLRQRSRHLNKYPLSKQLHDFMDELGYEIKPAQPQKIGKKTKKKGKK